MSTQRVAQLTRVYIPQADASVDAARSQECAIRAESKGSHHILMAT